VKVAIDCIFVFGLLIFGLGSMVTYFRVTQNRYFHNAASSPTDFLTKVTRAHTNTAEFAPILAAMMLYLGSHNPPGWVTGTMILVTASRVLVVVGFLVCKTLEKLHPIKAVGAAGTYVFGLALTGALLLT
jgi:uncharacterized protein